MQSLFVGWNAAKSAPAALADPAASALAKNQTFVTADGLNSCKFRLDAQLNFTVGANEQKSVDLSGGGNHLLVAIGAGTADSLSYHDGTKVYE